MEKTNSEIFFSDARMSKISHATFGRIWAIVPGFIHIRLRNGRIPGRSPKFDQKWRFEFWKNGHANCLVWEPGNVLIGTQDISWLEHRTCRDWNTRDILSGTHEIMWLEHMKRNLLIGTHEIFWFEHRKSFDLNIRNLLIGTQEIFWLGHTKSFDSNTRNLLIRTQEIFWRIDLEL